MSSVDQPKVSVIVPVFNVERFLPQCVDALTNQTLQDIELIFVDDGSSDGSKLILDDAACADKRIRVLHQLQNTNAGAARNAGLDVARGEYLSILDSDDFFEPNMLEDAYNRAKQHDADVVLYRGDRFYEAIQKYVDVPWMLNVKKFPKNYVFPPNDVQPNIFRSMVGWTWDKLFRRRHIEENGIRFQEQRIFNDMFFVYAAVLSAKRITILDEVLVHQRKRGGGSLSDTRAKYLSCLFDAIMALGAFLDERGLRVRYHKEFQNYIVHLLDNNAYSLNQESEEFRTFLSMLRDNWFEKLEVFSYPRSFYYVPTEYDRLRALLHI